MNERYRYGYGEDFPHRDFPHRDFPFSRQGAMTDQREEEAPREDAEAEERAERGDEEVEEQQVERMREVHAADESRAGDPGATMPFQPVRTEGERPAAPVAATEAPERQDAAAERRDDDAEAAAEGGQEDTPRRESIFEVADEEPAESGQPAPPQAAQPSLAGERPPIALGPPTPPAAPPVPQAPAAPAAPAAATAAPATPAAPAAATYDGPRPGQVTETRASLLASIDRESIRGRFVDIQAGFVDEPRQAVQEAEQFVDELVQQLVGALEAERAKLKAAIDDGSTEDLRIALRGYRAFVDRLLNLTL
jgi:hypothetical protein